MMIIKNFVPLNLAVETSLKMETGSSRIHFPFQGFRIANQSVHPICIAAKIHSRAGLHARFYGGRRRQTAPLLQRPSPRGCRRDVAAIQRVVRGGAAGGQAGAHRLPVPPRFQAVRGKPRARPRLQVTAFGAALLWPRSRST